MIQNLFIRPIILFLLLLMGIATVKGETEEFPNTLQATGTLKLDTVTLHYKLNLHLTAPEQNSYGELHVYVGEGQQPVQTYYVTKVQNGWPGRPRNSLFKFLTIYTAKGAIFPGGNCSNITHTAMISG